MHPQFVSLHVCRTTNPIMTLLGNFIYLCNLYRLLNILKYLKGGSSFGFTHPEDTRLGNAMLRQWKNSAYLCYVHVKILDLLDCTVFTKINSGRNPESCLTLRHIIGPSRLVLLCSGGTLWISDKAPPSHYYEVLEIGSG